MEKRLPLFLLAAALIPCAFAGNDDAAMKATLRAARSGPAALERHLSDGGDVDATDEDGETALMEAADDGLYAAVTLLLAAGANINATDEDGETALMKAADEGHLTIVHALLASGADPALRDCKGRTALDHARKEGHGEIVSILSTWGK